MGEQVVIRPARAEDAECCGEIAVQAWRPIFHAWREILGDSVWKRVYGDWELQKRSSVVCQLRDHTHLAAVSEREGEIVGFLTWRLDHDRQIGQISNNAVDPGCQGHGVGTAQIEWALDYFRSEGMRAARVLTGGDPGHAPARAMYEKAGFARALPCVEYFLEL
ncbi:MAG TPA: GNAT family N-acetyltransferase [Armatimonadetes bacterium]|nr:GNAT family N-acetyltransferase [Armatimonadota bacterium]